MTEITTAILLSFVMVAVTGYVQRRCTANMFRAFGITALSAYLLQFAGLTLLSRKLQAVRRIDLMIFGTLRRSFFLPLGFRETLRRLITGEGDAVVVLVSTEYLIHGIQNILLCVPLGYLLPSAFESLRKRGILHILLIGASLSLATELLQTIFCIGDFQIDDIINNTLGTLFGYVIARIQLWPPKWTPKRE